MNVKLPIATAIASAIAFAAWELVGHRYLMTLPMTQQHVISGTVGALLAFILVGAVVQVVLRQQRELQELARLRDFLLRMEAHYRRLSPSSRADPKLRFEAQARNEQFVNAQRSFASRSPIVRAKAAVEMAEIAQEPLAGAEEVYPFFERASAHLAVGLYLEREASVRAEMQRAISTMAEFAGKRNPKLLDSLVDDLAHANRSAVAGFEEALAAHLSNLDALDNEAFRSLDRIARLHDIESLSAALLRDIANSDECSKLIAARKAFVPAGGDPKDPGGKETRQQIEELNTAVRGLLDSRDSLAGALRLLAAPPDLAPEGDAMQMGLWRPKQSLPLFGCFLAYAELDNSHMEGANLRRAWMQGAHLSGAQLLRADMGASRLEDAHLNSACLQYANLDGAALQGAGLSSAQMQGANLSRARLEGAYLIGTDLRNAILWMAVVEYGQGDQVRRADFKNANWWEARFKDPLSGDNDKAIQAWLGTLFKRPLERPAGETLAAIH